MEPGVTEQDRQIIEKIKLIVPKLSSSSKDKLLTIVETMTILHEVKRTVV